MQKEMWQQKGPFSWWIASMNMNYSVRLTELRVGAQQRLITDAHFPICCEKKKKKSPLLLLAFDSPGTRQLTFGGYILTQADLQRADGLLF